MMRIWSSALLLLALACHEGEQDDAAQPHAEIVWVVPPADSVTLGDSLTASWKVETDGEIHVAQLRACMGEDAHCGLELYDEDEYASEDAGTWSATLTLPSAGTWTVVAWAHVDEDPVVSSTVMVTVK